MKNPTELTRRLIDAHVDFVLVGGFAAAAHGVTLRTRDVDRCCRFDEPNLRRIQTAVAALHPGHRSRPDLPFELTADECMRLRNLSLRTDLGPLDCLGEILGVGGFHEVLSRSIQKRPRSTLRACRCCLAGSQAGRSSVPRAGRNCGAWA
jgi:hypothetical protein